MISKKFRASIKLSETPAWKIAQQAGVSPSVLSKIMIGAIQVKPGDHRVKSVAEVIGLDEKECFEANGRGEAGYGN
jgi:hypothetical protein